MAKARSDYPVVSVIMPHYHDLDGLRTCLEALQRQSYPSDRVEIIVADNASPEGLDAVQAAVDGRARVVIVPEKGAGPARNGGVAAAAGDILAFTDSDCLPEVDWLVNGVAALADCDFVGGSMRVLVDDETSMTPAEAFEVVFAFDNETYVTRQGFTVTANLFCPREVFAAVGGFRTGVSEDLDWSQRAGEAGFRIGYAAGAVVGHPARRTWRELQRKWSRTSAEAHGLVKDTPSGRLRWVLRSLALPATAVAHTPRVLRAQRLGSLRTKLAALGVLYRLRLWRGLDGLRLALVAGRG